MKITEKRKREPIEYDAIVSVICDMCKKEITRASNNRDTNWCNATYDRSTQQTVIVEYNEVYHNIYEDHDYSNKIIVDLCPKCFKEKLLVWLESQGVQPNIDEYDW